MLCKKQAAAPSISPVLFMSVDGQPMSFFLRPGPVKCKLQPLIKAGGGLLCNVQQPGAILLIAPEEKSSVPESSVHWYVSTQYIYDCIEKEEQLNLEDYRLNPDVVQRQSARLNMSKDSSSARLSGGRVAYTAEDDAAILNYVSKRKTETGGNRLWQEMEKQRVTAHSWQSMKSRYKDQLVRKQLGVVEVETAEEEAAEDEMEVEPDQESNVDQPSSETDVVPPQTHSAESDMTQIDVQSSPVGLVTVDPQTPNSPIDEQKNQQADKLREESTQSETVEPEASHSLQTDEPRADLQTVTEPDGADPTEPGPQPTSSPNKQSSEEESVSAEPEPSPKTTSSKKQKENQKASDNLEQPQRRVTRRQLELEAAASPEPYGKKLRSSSSSTKPITSTPQSMKKTKPPVKSAQTNASDQPPPKRSKAKMVEAVAESQSQPKQSDHDDSAEPAQADETNTAPQKAEKKRGKRQLGILELATKEFEDESESDEEDSPDLSDRAETAGTSKEPLPPPTNTATDPAFAQSIAETGSSPQANAQGSQASGDNCVPDTGPPAPAAAEPAVPEPAGAASKAHLFIFESESQEDAESVDSHPSAAPSSLRHAVDGGIGPSLTQMQLEEDKQRVRELMKQTGQDLVSVTKALLKTSGDFSLASELLLNPSMYVPIWSLHDDNLLLSADPDARQQLQEKYGEENVAKRMVFLEVEG